MKKWSCCCCLLAVLFLSACGVPGEQEGAGAGKSAGSLSEAPAVEEKKPTVPEGISEDMKYLYEVSFADRYEEEINPEFSLAWPDGTELILYEQRGDLKLEQEIEFDGDGLKPYAYKRYWSGDPGERRMVGTHHYELDGLEYIDYLWSDVPGVKTARGVSVGSSEQELLTAYPEDLYYISRGEALSERVLGVYEIPEAGFDESAMEVKEEFEFDFAYCWQPFEDNDCRDVTFYFRDGSVCAVEAVSPFELRHVYGFDREASLHQTELAKSR